MNQHPSLTSWVNTKNSFLLLFYSPTKIILFSYLLSLMSQLFFLQYLHDFFKFICTVSLFIVSLFIFVSLLWSCYNFSAFPSIIIIIIIIIETLYATILILNAILTCYRRCTLRPFSFNIYYSFSFYISFFLNPQYIFKSLLTKLSSTFLHLNYDFPFFFSFFTFNIFYFFFPSFLNILSFLIHRSFLHTSFIFTLETFLSIYLSYSLMLFLCLLSFPSFFSFYLIYTRPFFFTHTHTHTHYTTHCLHFCSSLCMSAWLLRLIFFLFPLFFLPKILFLPLSPSAHLSVYRSFDQSC